MVLLFRRLLHVLSLREEQKNDEEEEWNSVDSSHILKRESVTAMAVWWRSVLVLLLLLNIRRLFVALLVHVLPVALGQLRSFLKAGWVNSLMLARLRAPRPDMWPHTHTKRRFLSVSPPHNNFLMTLPPRKMTPASLSLQLRAALHPARVDWEEEEEVSDSPGRRRRREPPLTGRRNRRSPRPAPGTAAPPLAACWSSNPAPSPLLPVPILVCSPTRRKNTEIIL